MYQVSVEYQQNTVSEFISGQRQICIEWLYCNESGHHAYISQWMRGRDQSRQSHNEPSTYHRIERGYQAGMSHFTEMINITSDFAHDVTYRGTVRIHNNNGDRSVIDTSEPHTTVSTSIQHNILSRVKQSLSQLQATVSHHIGMYQPFALESQWKCQQKW